MDPFSLIFSIFLDSIGLISGGITIYDKIGSKIVKYFREKREDAHFLDESAQIIENFKSENREQGELLERIIYSNRKLLGNVITKQDLIKFLVDHGVDHEIAKDFSSEINKRVGGVLKHFIFRHPDQSTPIILENVEFFRDFLEKYLRFLNFRSIYEVLCIPTGNESPDNPKFFRKPHPLWIDFEKGYVVESDELKHIISLIEQGSGVNLVGFSGSGKTVTALNVGYNFAKGIYVDEKFEVYYISALIFEDAAVQAIISHMNLKDEEAAERTLLIIEDIHLNPQKTNQILWVAKQKGFRVLLTSRPFHQDILRDNILYNFEKVKITPDLVNKKIVEKYVEKQLEKPEINERDVKKLLKNSKNLVLLSYSLRAFENNETLNNKVLYRLVSEDLEELRRNSFGGEQEFKELILTLAPFSAYQILLIRSFLRDNKRNLGFNESTINGLIGVGELIEIMTHRATYYLLPQARVAEIYVEASKEIPRLTEDLRNRLQSKDSKFGGDDKKWDIELIRLYLRTQPLNYRMVIELLPKNTLREVLKDEETRKAVISKIKSDPNLKLREFGRILVSIVSCSDEIVESIKPDVIERIKDSNLTEISEYAFNFPTKIEALPEPFTGIANKLLLEKFVYQRDAFEKKSTEPDGLSKVYNFYSKQNDFAVFFFEEVLSLSPKIFRKSLSRRKIRKIQRVYKKLLAKLEELKSLADELPENEDMLRIKASLNLFIELCKNPSEFEEFMRDMFEECVEKLRRIDPERINSLFRGTVDLNVLVEKIEKARDLYGLDSLLISLYMVNKELARELTERIINEKFARKIVELKGFNEAKFCLSALALTNDMKSRELLEEISDKELVGFLTDFLEKIHS